MTTMERVDRRYGPHPEYNGRPTQTHCKRGHPLEGTNLYRDRDEYDRCRACQRIRGIAYYHRLHPDASYRAIRKSDG